MFLLVGAPKANTTQPGIVEGGQVLKCDWSSHRRCQPIEFDATGNRDYAKDDPLEFKSHQWFGASVRSKQDKILACAPLYHWRTEMKQEREPVGTCFLQDGTKTVEYAPCRSKNIDADGQGFCQGGFSIDFTKADRVLLGGPGSFYWQGISFSGREGSVSWACVGTKDGFFDSRSGLFKRHNYEYIKITCSFNTLNIAQCRHSCLL